MSDLSSHYEARWEDLSGGLDPADVIPGLLVPSEHRTMNEIFYVDGRDDLVVRRMSELDLKWQSFQQTLETAAAFDRLTEFGVRSLPFIPLKLGGEVYLVTKRVYGQGLEDAVNDSEFTDTTISVSNLDDNWEGLGEYYLDAYRRRIPYATDITAPHQYMVGKAGRDTEMGLHMVDLSELTMDWRGPHEQINIRHFEDEIYGDYGYAADVVKLENILGHELKNARLKIIEILGEVATNTIESTMDRERIKKMLETGNVPKE